MLDYWKEQPKERWSEFLLVGTMGKRLAEGSAEVREPVMGLLMGV